MSAASALNRFYQRQAREVSRRPKRRNKKPEADLEKVLVPLFSELGLAMHKIESKAVYSASAGRYITGQAEAGMSDYIGNTKYGTAAFIEVKAPGKRATLKVHQREFLLSKILSGCFAVCIDSTTSLVEIYNLWNTRMRMEPMLARNILIMSLPKEPKERKDDSENSDLGF